jgi:hypothetical protein
MTRDTVPNAGSNYKVSNPVPDMLYGYNPQVAFPQQQTPLISMGLEMIANNQSLVYPFLVIEFEGDGPSGAGSFWAAINQCLGGSASCVKIGEGPNRRLSQCNSKEVRMIDNAVFGVSMSGSEVRLLDRSLVAAKGVSHREDWLPVAGVAVYDGAELAKLRMNKKHD